MKGYRSEKIIFKDAPSRAKRIVSSGDTIVSTVRTYLKAITRIEDATNVIVSTGFTVLTPKKNVLSSFCSNWVISETLINRINAISKGVSYPATNATEIGDLYIVLPPLSEQKEIASYLDTTTGQLDQKIDLLDKKAVQYEKLKQSLIDEIVTCGLDKSAPIRNCNVHLIKEIPEHWKICRLKEVGYLYSGLTGKSGDDFINENEYSEPYVPFTNIANNFYLSTSELKSVCISPSEKQNFVKKYDLFFLMSSEDYADLGKCSLLRSDMEKKTYLNSFCKGFRFTKHSINPSYINYLLHSTPYRITLSNEGNGFTRINLRMEKINDIQILVPPQLEQQAISKYLDEKTMQIDAILKSISAEIEKLKSLRKALINDVVTGKIKVTSEGLAV
ncbi:restriction endonuclease subunit S [Polynucleobacter aenigmaticus]|uniref:restriction endonuclease subunit S n=1 Tax=Polynucleobacter aenigmaticus TaxID=1743164 RepID=UPI0023E45F1C|nr:restriction endonuclease subunit S [Polynucleobacter aenigmaticus]